MSFNQLTSGKKNYQTPNLEKIELDNEISLALESPAAGPGEPGYTGYRENHLNKDPFNNTIV